MIARLKGTLSDKTASRVVVMAGGVGYDVHIPLPTFYDLPEDGREVDLYVSTVVREDAIELFGFLTQVEKGAFLLLNSVSKVGPRLALAILSGIGPADLAAAVRDNDVIRLSKIPGVGKKTAERLALELKDKLAKLAPAIAAEPAAEPPTPADEADSDVISALMNLGYKQIEAEKALKAARQDAGDSPQLADLIRISLKKLQKA